MARGRSIDSELSERYVTDVSIRTKGFFGGIFGGNHSGKLAESFEDIGDFSLLRLPDGDGNEFRVLNEPDSNGSTTIEIIQTHGSGIRFQLQDNQKTTVELYNLNSGPTELDFVRQPRIESDIQRLWEKAGRS